MFGFGKKNKLKKKQPRVAVLVADGVEQAQLDPAVRRLRDAKIEVFMVGAQPGTVQALRARKPGAKVIVDATLDEVHPASFGALVIPGGGAAAERLRRDPRVIEFVRAFDRNRKPIAVIGMGGRVLLAADAVRGRTLTARANLRDELELDGAIYKDTAVVADEHLLTGRSSKDAAKWARKLIKHFAAYAPTTLDMQRQPQEREHEQGG